MPHLQPATNQLLRLGSESFEIVGVPVDGNRWLFCSRVCGWVVKPVKSGEGAQLAAFSKYGQVARVVTQGHLVDRARAERLVNWFGVGEMLELLGYAQPKRDQLLASPIGRSQKRSL